MNETREQAVERLKKNMLQFQCLSKGDRDILIEVGRENCLFSKQIWEKPVGGAGTLNPTDIYRIRPDYHEETAKSEYVPCEIKADGDDLVYYRPENKRKLFIFAPGCPDFRGFFFWIDGKQGREVGVSEVARQIDEGFKVVARFERR